MAKDNLSSKLAVILHADIAGSTVLVQQDERLTHERIQDAFRRFSETIEKYQGHVRELRGDALLADFERPSDAVTAALAFQADHACYIEQLNDDIRPTARVGIAMGEVIIADSTVTGAGVVLAQRVEQLSEPGGVCITAAIHEGLPKRLPFNQADMGERQVKGFDEPVRVYAVSLNPGGVIPKPEALAYPDSAAPAVPDKPSIAVLPFNNLSNNPEQDYICDCIAEDIIANLCCYREIFVIDHHSTLEFRDVGTDAVLFAKELGVEYITKGSIRQSKDQIRISVQLIETATGKAVWADRIDRKFDDLFAIEDEIAARLASSLVSHIEDESSARAMRKHPENMTAFDCVMRARRFARSYDRDQNAAARRLLDKAIGLDPEYAAAYAYLSGSYIVEADAGWGESREDAIERAITYALKAVSLDDFDSGNHAAMGAAYMYQKKFELAEVHLDRAIECNPNSYGAFCAKSWVLALSGRASEVMDCGNTALRLNPLAPDDCLLAIIIAHYIEHKYDAALGMIARVRVPYAISEVCRAACLAQLGRDDEARDAAISAIEMGGNIIQQGKVFHCWPFKNPGDLEHLMDGLQKSVDLLEPTE